MPDVWTANPPKLRRALEQLGAQCGEESRVLHPRDPYWTCQSNGESVSYDIYIHDLSELYKSTPLLCLFIIIFIGGIFVGLLWGKRFWRHS